MYPFKLILLLFFILLVPPILSQTKGDRKYSKIKEAIHIDTKKNELISEIEIKGTFYNTSDYIEYITFSELESIEKIDAKYENYRRKLKKLSQKTFTNTSIVQNDVFYSGNKAILIPFPFDTKSFSYSYRRLSKDIMYLPALPIIFPIKTDTIEYTIEIPNSYLFLYKNFNETVKIDSVLNDSSTLYIFNSTQTIENESEEITLENTKHEHKDKFIQIAISKKGVNPWTSFGNWYFNLVDKQNKITNETIKNFEYELSQTSKKAKIQENDIFEFINDKISYISFENGIGAFQPRDPNSIFDNKKGDCKDMANLLCQILVHYGYESYLGICSTQSHEFDSNFPSISSFNHVVCVIKKNNKWIYLDATQDNCEFGSPSTYIQGRDILVVRKDSSIIEKIEIIPAESNRNTIQIVSKKNKNRINSQLNFVIHKQKFNDINTSFDYLSKKDFDIFLAEKIKSIFSRNIISDNITFKSELDSTVIQTDFYADNSIVTEGIKTFILLNWLPFPHNLIRKEIVSDYYILDQTFSNDYECKIEIEKNKKLNAFKKLDYKDENFTFSISIDQVENNIIIKYSFKSNKIILNKEEIKKFNELNIILNNTFNSAISYE